MTHDELNAALDLQRKIARLQARLDGLRQTGGVGHPGGNTPVQGGAGVFVGQQVIELAQEITELQEQLRDEQAIIRRCLQKLDLSDIERKIMILRFAECRLIDSVALSVGYTGRDGKATRQFYRIYERAKKTTVNDSRRHLKPLCQ